MPPHMPPPPHGHPYPIAGGEYAPSPNGPNGNTLPPINVDQSQQSSQDSAASGDQKENKDESRRDDERADSQRASSPPVIDPSLDKPSSTTASTQKENANEKQSPEESLKIAQAAIEVALKYEEERERRSRQASAAPEAKADIEKPKSISEKREAPDGKKKAEEANTEKKDANPSPRVVDEKQIEQMLTEDGEPMLNPG